MAPGPQDVHAHEEFEVTASVTNTGSTPKVLWLLINVPMNAATLQLLKQQHQQRESEKGTLQLPALLEGGLVPHENMIPLGCVETFHASRCLLVAVSLTIFFLGRLVVVERCAEL